MPLAYSDEKFSAAIRLLALGRDRIKPRLIDAVATSIVYIQPERDLPEFLREDFATLLDRMTNTWPSESTPGGGKLQATINKMSEDEAVEVASEILSLAYRVKVALEDERQETK